MSLGFSTTCNFNEGDIIMNPRTGDEFVVYNIVEYIIEFRGQENIEVRGNLHNPNTYEKLKENELLCTKKIDGEVTTKYFVLSPRMPIRADASIIPTANVYSMSDSRSWIHNLPVAELTGRRTRSRSRPRSRSRSRGGKKKSKKMASTKK
jgi:hypothetical protein